MSFEFHKNAVITGCVNSFCLACNSFLESKQDALIHIKTSTHRQKLSVAHHSVRFKDQGIKKFESGYFCECCNTLLQTASKVKLHISEDDHIQNRGTMLLKTMEHGIVAFNTVLIKERIWHSLVEDSCSICDIEFNDESQHKRNTAHILSLIQKPIKFGANDAIYRQIDDSIVQCLTCDLLVPSKTIKEHINDADHLNMYDKCKIETNGANINTQNKDKEIKQDEDNTNIRNVTKPTNEKDKNKICAKLNSTELTCSTEMNQNEIIDINLATETDCSKKCSVTIKFNHNDIPEHIEMNLDQTLKAKRYPTDVKQNDENICAKLNLCERIRSIKMYQNEGIDISLLRKTAFCRKCLVVLKFDLEDIKRHVQEHMKTKLEQTELAKQNPIDVKQKINSFKADNDAHDENEDCKSDIPKENMTSTQNVEKHRVNSVAASINSSENANRRKNRIASEVIKHPIAHYKSDIPKETIKIFPFSAVPNAQDVANHDAITVSACINSSSINTNRSKNKIEHKVIKDSVAANDAHDDNDDCKSNNTKQNIKPVPLLVMTTAQNVGKHDADAVSASINSSSKSKNRSKSRIASEVSKDPVAHCKSDIPKETIKILPRPAVPNSQNVEKHDVNVVSASINWPSLSTNRSKNRIEHKVVEDSVASNDARDDNEDSKSDNSKLNIKPLPLSAVTNSQCVEKHDANTVAASINSSSESTNCSKSLVAHCKSDIPKETIKILPRPAVPNSQNVEKHDVNVVFASINWPSLSTNRSKNRIEHNVVEDSVASNDARDDNEDSKSDNSKLNIKLPLSAVTNSQCVEKHDANTVAASINSSSKSTNCSKSRIDSEVNEDPVVANDVHDENEHCKNDRLKGNMITLPLTVTSSQNVEKNDANAVSAGIDLTFKSSTNHIKNRIEPEVIDVQRFAEENNINYREGAFSNCCVCKVKIPSTIRSIEEHLKGGSHLKKLAILDCSLQKVDMKSFVFSLRNLRLERHFTQSFVINEQHCINELSYYMIMESKGGLRCLLCEIDLNCDRIFYKKHVDDHVTNTSHLAEMEKMPVITAVKTDFIREIRPRSFHCGCCNCVVKGWTMMKRHLLSQGHKDLIERGHKITVVFNR